MFCSYAEKGADNKQKDGSLLLFLISGDSVFLFNIPIREHRGDDSEEVCFDGISDVQSSVCNNQAITKTQNQRTN